MGSSSFGVLSLEKNGDRVELAGRGAEADEPAVGFRGMTALIWGLAERATFTYTPRLLQDIYLLSSSNELSFGAEYRHGPINSGHQGILFFFI